AYHSVALCSDGTLVAWGFNRDGELGNNSATNSSIPVLVSASVVLAGKTVTAVAAGLFHSLALCSDGTLTAWGSNSNGKLGNNSTTDSNVPVLVSTNGLGPGERWILAATGPIALHSLALAAKSPPWPGSSTLAATSITGTSATLNGLVNASNNSTTVSFD